MEKTIGKRGRKRRDEGAVGRPFLETGIGVKQDIKEQSDRRLGE